MIMPVEKKRATMIEVYPRGTLFTILLYMNKQPKTKNTPDMIKPNRVIIFKGMEEWYRIILKLNFINFQ